MSGFKFCADKMRKSLKKLKNQSYEQIRGFSKYELQRFVYRECKDCTAIRRKIYAKGWVKIEMEVKEELEPEVTEWPDDLHMPEIFVESISSVDGFDIYSDGEIVEMHPPDCDD